MNNLKNFVDIYNKLLLEAKRSDSLYHSKTYNKLTFNYESADKKFQKILNEIKIEFNSKNNINVNTLIEIVKIVAQRISEKFSNEKTKNVNKNANKNNEKSSKESTNEKNDKQSSPDIKSETSVKVNQT